HPPNHESERPYTYPPCVAAAARASDAEPLAIRGHRRLAARLRLALGFRRGSQRLGPLTRVASSVNPHPTLAPTDRCPNAAVASARRFSKARRPGPELRSGGASRPTRAQATVLGAGAAILHDLDARRAPLLGHAPRA